MTGVGGHIGEGDAQGGDVAGQGFIPQRPHQHDRHILPRDVGHRLKERLVAGNAVGTGCLGGRVIPVAGPDIGEGGRGRQYVLPGEHAL